MLEPLVALGLVANVFQLSDFLRKALSDANEIYHATSGTLVRNSDLDAMSMRLMELTMNLEKDLLHHDSGSLNNSLLYNTKIDALDKQLLDLASEAQAIGRQLKETLDKLKGRKGTRWESVRKAVLSAWSRDQLQNFENRLRAIREQIHTNLLVSLRTTFDKLERRMDESATSNLPAQKKKRLQAQDTRETLQKLIDGISDVELPIHSSGRLNYAQILRKEYEGTFCALTDSLLRNKLTADKVEAAKMNSVIILELLKYETMPDRHEEIHVAHEGTFDWILSDYKPPTTHMAHYHDLAQWLQGRAALYWITGKPGAGKSTLMKYLRHAKRTPELADDGENGAFQILRSFLWSLSSSGMLMLDEMMNEIDKMKKITESDKTTLKLELILRLFGPRMARCEIFGGDLSRLSMSELLEALQALLSTSDRAYLIFIDGLDEFEGPSEDVIEVVQALSAYECAKVCVASRYWTAFADAFEFTPQLRMEYLTQNDISRYIGDKFAESRRFVQLQAVMPQAAHELKQGIIGKAQGVFLWVYLVVTSLKEGLRDGDNIALLRQRLEDMPAELEALFDKMISDLPPNYAVQASHIFQFFRANPEDSTLLALDCSFNSYAECITRQMDAPSNEEIKFRIESMKRMLYSRSKCFLEVAEPCDLTTKVRYLHRTARDFIENQGVWNRIEEHLPNFDTARALCISRLMQVKVLTQSPRNQTGLLNLLCRLLSELIFTKAINSFENLEQRVAFFDTVAWLGDAVASRFFTSSSSISASWTTILGERGMVTPPWAKTDLRSNADLQASMKPIKDIYEVALRSDHDWFIGAKIRDGSVSKEEEVDGQTYLSFAAHRKMYKMQIALLEAGASPNGPPWKCFLDSYSPSADLDERGEGLDAFVSYLDHGADTSLLNKAIIGRCHNANAQARVWDAWQRARRREHERRWVKGKARLLRFW